MQRLISADDHVDVSHDQVKSHLSSKYHADYDEAVAEFQEAMAGHISGEANQRWREQQGLPADHSETMSANRKHAAFGRAGHTDPYERLKDMDTDGVDASSSYCEVSAFRYLYLIKNGWKEATRAFNTALSEFASADPETADRVLSSADPRYRRGRGRSTSGGGSRVQVVATSGVPRRARTS